MKKTPSHERSRRLHNADAPARAARDVRQGRGTRSHLVPPCVKGGGSCGEGEPLPDTTRSFFESRFGHDFSRVRVHTDAQADRFARAAHARAYTVGQDIVFGGGQFAPASESGAALLAHELTHTIQQRGVPRSALRVSKHGDAAEREADAAASRALHGSGLPRVGQQTGPALHGAPAEIKHAHGSR